MAVQMINLEAVDRYCHCIQVTPHQSISMSLNSPPSMHALVLIYSIITITIIIIIIIIIFCTVHVIY